MKIERISKTFHLILTRITSVGLLLPSILITIGNYFILHLGTESYYLSCPLWFVWHPTSLFDGKMHDEFIDFLLWIIVRLPFSWKTPTGFAIAILIESLSCFSVLYSILPTVCFTVGSYLLVVAAIKVIANDFQILCSRIATENSKKVKELFIDIISDITDVKKLSVNQIEMFVQ